jgi:hypothetical protein
MNSKNKKFFEFTQKVVLFLCSCGCGNKYLDPVTTGNVLIDCNSYMLKDYYGIRLRFVYIMTEVFQKTTVIKLAKFVESSKEHSV